MRKPPTEAEVLGYTKSLCNWGRWGQDDERGTLNLVTPQKRLEAARLVKHGVTVSCARPITFNPAADIIYQPMHFMVESGEGYQSGQKLVDRPVQSSSDFFGLVFHGVWVTHVDALCHIFWKGQMYNGRPAHLVSTRMGGTVSNIEQLRDGLVTRGVLLDVARQRGKAWFEVNEAVYPEDLDAAEQAQGVKVGPGDVLLVRTGWFRRRREIGPPTPQLGRPGLQAACLPWLRQRDVAMLGSDTAQDPNPSGYPSFSLPIHEIGIVQMGLWLLDNANLEELSATCERLGTWEFMLTIGTLRLDNATGSPCNPIAVF